MKKMWYTCTVGLAQSVSGFQITMLIAVYQTFGAEYSHFAVIQWGSKGVKIKGENADVLHGD